MTSPDPIDEASKPLIELIKCKLCGKEFKPTKSWQLFCCSKHRDKWHNIQRALEETPS